MDFKKEGVIGAGEYSECALDHKNHGESVCSERAVLEKMKEMVNRSSGVVKSPGDAKKGALPLKGGDPVEEEKLEIVEDAKRITECGSESCVVKKMESKGLVKGAASAFKPDGPRKSTEWFSNSNIDEALEMIVRAYPERKFHHVPFAMRDFAKKKKTDVEKKELAESVSAKRFDEIMSQDLINTDFVKLYKEGIRCFGVVFNTDYSTGRGQHWFCVFGDFSTTPMTLEYFNSSGEAPLAEIDVWLNELRHTLESGIGKKTEIYPYSSIPHQEDSHSCGAYSIYYIYSRVHGVHPDVMQKNKLLDSDMHEFRNFLFNHSND